MIDDGSREKLVIITFLMDATILSILLGDRLNNFDLYYGATLVLSHLLFYYALYYYEKGLLDILHIFVFIYIFLASFLQNQCLLTLITLVLVSIQLLWITEGKCILNENDEVWGCCKYVHAFSIFMNSFLCFKLGSIVVQNSV